MKTYKSNNGKETGVEAYEIGDDYILVKFWIRLKPYKYTYDSCGEKAVKEMEKRALASAGLSTYISQQDPPYEDDNGNFVRRKKETA